MKYNINLIKGEPIKAFNRTLFKLRKNGLLNPKNSALYCKSKFNRFSKKYLTHKQIKIIQISLLGLGVSGTIASYQPSRKIVILLGAKLKSILLTSTQDASDLNTSVKESNNPKISDSKWQSGVGLVLIGLKVIAIILKMINESESDIDINPRSRTYDIIVGVGRVLKDATSVGLVFVFVGLPLTIIGIGANSFPTLCTGQSLVITGWQLITNVGKNKFK